MKLTFEPPQIRLAADHRAVAAALRARPGEWALIPRPYPPRSARSTANSIRRGLLASYAPAGAYEAVSRTADGRARIWVRYIGGSPQKAA